MESHEPSHPEGHGISKTKNALCEQKGSPQDSNMDRGVSVGSIIVKLLGKIVFKVSAFYES